MRNPKSAGVTLSLLLLALGGCEPEPDAGAYPRRPIKLVVPFGVGGGSDTFARIIKKAFDDHRLLPQPLVIINVGGAGGTIGSRRVKDARPDGYTVLLLHDAILTAQLSGTVNYGPESFEPIAGTGEVPEVLAVRGDSPYGSLDELLDAVQRQPNTISFAANLGAPSHFAGLRLEKQRPGAAFRFTQTGGGAARFAVLEGGHVDATSFSLDEFLRFEPAGLKALAYFGAERHPALPGVPTAREQGCDLVSSNMFFWWMPKGTSPEKVEVFAGALERALDTAYVRGKLDEIHCDPIVLRGPRLTAKIDALTEELAGVAPRPTVKLPNLPLYVGAAAGLLAAGIAVRSWRRRPAAASVQPVNQPPLQRGLAIGCLVVTAGYVLAMAAGGLDFRPATIGFVLIAGVLLSRGDTRLLPALAVTALALGLGLHYLFTRVFVIDLP